MPEFQERDQAARELRQERLGEAIQAALGRREPARHAPEGYEVKASGQA
jgi:hypothetical protein